MYARYKLFCQGSVPVLLLSIAVGFFFLSLSFFLFRTPPPQSRPVWQESLQYEEEGSLGEEPLPAAAAGSLFTSSPLAIIFTPSPIPTSAALPNTPYPRLSPRSTPSTLAKPPSRRNPAVVSSPNPSRRTPAPPAAPSAFSHTDCAARLASSSFYRDDSLQALRVVRELSSQGRKGEVELLKIISCEPQAIWITGGTVLSVKERIAVIVKKARGSGKIPVLVLYNIPDHTRAKWGSGVQEEGYGAWIQAAAEGIGGSEAWIMLEPDSISLAFNYPADEREVRFRHLREAARIFRKETPAARVYLDGGHSTWRRASDQAAYLRSSGIEDADGFFTNVANFRALSEEIKYGNALSVLVGGKHFVVDTSRNGNGPRGGEWCNPRGRALGASPSRVTGEPFLDAYLWIKPPGESDGSCNGGPPPGKFWLDYALELIRNSLS